MPRHRTDLSDKSQAPLLRQWILLRLLSARWTGATVQEIARELETSVKTVRRDLALFKQLGFPLQEIRQAHGRKKWVLNQPPAESWLGFAFDEALALYLSRRLLDPIAGSPFWEAAQRAFRKIRAMLSSEALKYVEKFAHFFYPTSIGVSDYTGKSQLIDLLMIAIEDQRAVDIVYTSLRAKQPETYRVHPYGIVFHRGSLYLVGFSTKHHEIRHWKVDRMEQVEISRDGFCRPADFDLRAHLAGSFGIFRESGNILVRVRFAPEVSRYVQEKRWHDSQRLLLQAGGSIIAEFRLNTTKEIKHWILSFGRLAEVLEPEELRQELAEEASALNAIYSRKSFGKAIMEVSDHQRTKGVPGVNPRTEPWDSGGDRSPKFRRAWLKDA